MPYEKTKLRGLFVFEPWLQLDQRGSFHEAFKVDLAKNETGLFFETRQLNVSVSNKGVLRGVHFKQNPPGQRKFVRVEQGSIYDVVVDLRKNSPTLGQWVGFELSSVNRRSLLIDNGLGHGFLALESDTVVSYLCDTEYDPNLEYGFNPFSFAIDWEYAAGIRGIHEITTSDRDRNAPKFSKDNPLLFN